MQTIIWTRKEAGPYYLNLALVSCQSLMQYLLSLMNQWTALFIGVRAEGDRFTNFSSVQPTSNKWVIMRENRRTVRSIAFIKQTLIFNGFTSEMNDRFLKN